MESLLNYYLYTTLAGDTFDSIALDFYNEESLATIIIQDNPEYRKTLLFKGGEQLKIRIMDAAVPATSLPPWKRGQR